jgi:hypothetical protein
MITTDNLRKLRRVLQGHGVNFRETLGDVDSYSVVSVAGLRKDDVIISVLDMTDLVDVGAQIIRAVAASREFGSSNSRITFTARKAGVQGNKIRVAYLNDQVQSVAGATEPLRVTVENTLSSGTLYTDVKVHLALKTDGTVDTTATSGPNSANAVRAAVLTQADAPGHPRAADIVDVTIANGSGVTYVGTMAATVLQNGADDSQVGATPDTLTDAEGLVWTERYPGAASRDAYITVTETSAGKVLIDVHLATDGSSTITTTRNQVAQMVEDSYRRKTSAVGDDGAAGGPQGAADYVSVAYPDDATVVSAHAAADLTGGSTDGGFTLSTSPHDSGGNVVKVLWVSVH